MGAGKAHIADWSPLTDKHVIIIADNDDPGLNHAEDIADILDGIAHGERRQGGSRQGRQRPHRRRQETLRVHAVTGFDDTDPIPLTGLVSLSSFPTDAFPTPIADMVRDVAEATQTDLAMAGTSASRRCPLAPAVTSRSRYGTAGSNRCAPTARPSPNLASARAPCKGR